MSLRQQLLGGSLLAVLFVYALLFLGMELRLQHYFQSQLSSHAQDTATSLAVAVNTALRQQDGRLLETTVQAVFDNGYYARIAVLDNHGRTLLEKLLPPANADVPAWLPRLIRLDAPLRNAYITSGWQQAGTVEVTSQPAFAYRELWQLLQDAAVWLSAAIACTMLLMAALVRSILRPLDQIERAALSVSHNNFPVISRIPRTRELGRVVLAFNALSATVRQMLAGAEDSVAKFRRQSLTDTLTGAGNHRSLVAQLDALLESPQGEYALALVEVGGLAELNQASGYVDGDKFVLTLAGALSALPHLQFLARVHGNGFGLILETATEPELAEILATACLQLEGICQSFGLPGGGHCAIGAVRMFHDYSASTALSNADEALARARKSGGSVLNWERGAGLSSTQWKQHLQEAMRENRFRLSAQSVFHYARDNPEVSDALLHQEIYARLTEHDGTLIAAAHFMPMAMRHGLAADIDRQCLRLLLRHMAAHDGRYSFNISRAVLLDHAFPDWLNAEMDDLGVSRARLILEMPESMVHNAPQDARRFADSLRRLGLSCGIDQFGLHKGTVSELAKLQPAFFKLATDLTRQCTSVAEYGEYIAWLAKTAQLFDIPVIATCIEESAWQERLLAAGVSGFQGRLISPVSALDVSPPG